MITQQELTVASPRQAILAGKFGVDTETNQMSGALAGFYTSKAIMMKKLRKLKPIVRAP